MTAGYGTPRGAAIVAGQDGARPCPQNPFDVPFDPSRFAASDVRP